MSIWLDTRNAIVTAVTAIPTIPAVKKRNRAEFRDKDPVQIVTISWADAKYFDPGLVYENNVSIVYGFDITIFDQENFLNDGDPTSLIGWNKSILQALYVLLPGVAGLYNYEVIPGVLAEPIGSQNGYFRSSIRVQFTVNELGNG